MHMKSAIAIDRDIMNIFMSSNLHVQPNVNKMMLA